MSESYFSGYSAQAMNLSNHINAPQQQTINFRGGLINSISPEARSEVSNLAKAATSKTAKDLARTLREQAIDSALNMSKYLINGNDMRHSLDRVEI